MRYLILFMLLVGIFVVGRRSLSYFKGVRAEGPVRTETRAVSGFNAIHLDIAGDLEVRTAEQYSVVVHAQESILPKLKTEMENGVLRIYVEGRVWSSDGMRVEVAGPAIERLVLAGSGTIQVPDAFKSEKLYLEVSGSGDIRASQLEAASVESRVSGSGSIRMGGSAREMSALIDGSGEILAGALTAENVEANISGSGTVRCAVRQHLGGSIGGSGSILYSGDPKVDVAVSGSGGAEQVDGEN